MNDSMAVDSDYVKDYCGGMIWRTVCDGRTYKLVEKNGTACLTVDDTRLLWWGPVNEIPPKIAPLEVLLKFSLMRGLT